MNHKYAVLVVLVFGMVTTGSNDSFAHVSKQQPGIVKHKFYEPHEVIDIFLKAVSRGELIVFEKRLDKSMITPVRVEYAYELNRAISSIIVYSELKQPMAVPNQKDCSVRAVSATLDTEGQIIEVKAHIWMD